MKNNLASQMILIIIALTLVLDKENKLMKCLQILTIILILMQKVKKIKKDKIYI